MIEHTALAIFTQRATVALAEASTAVLLISVCIHARRSAQRLFIRTNCEQKQNSRQYQAKHETFRENNTWRAFAALAGFVRAAIATASAAIRCVARQVVACTEALRLAIVAT